MGGRLRWREALAFARRARRAPIPRRKIRLTWLARMERIQEADLELLRELASHGLALEALTQHPSWARLLEVKEELQATATEQARAAASTDTQRRDGAVAYWAIEGLFGAMYRIIANGQKAQRTLRETVKTQTG